MATLECRMAESGVEASVGTSRRRVERRSRQTVTIAKRGPLVVLTGGAVLGRKYANTSTTLQCAIVLCKPDMPASCRPSPRTPNKQMFTFHRHFLVSQLYHLLCRSDYQLDLPRGSPGLQRPPVAAFSADCCAGDTFPRFGQFPAVLRSGVKVNFDGHALKPSSTIAPQGFLPAFS